jgi:tetraacyldisaccharide-1-P 4'-kinase
MVDWINFRWTFLIYLELRNINEQAKEAQEFTVFNTEKDTVKTKHLLAQSHTSNCDTKLNDFKIREVIIFNYVKYLNNYITMSYN